MKLLLIHGNASNTYYQHNILLKELKQQQIRERLNYTTTQRFHILMGLIRISERMKKIEKVLE